MTFAPPPSNGPGTPPPPPGSGPRSTPIPGQEGPAPSPYGGGTPPTPTQFVNGGPTNPYGPSFQTPPGMQYAPGPPQKSRGGSLFSLWLIIAIIGGVIGIGTGVWAFMRARDATDQADRILDNAEETFNTLTIPEVSIPEITIPPVSIPPITVPVSLPSAPVDPSLTTLPVDPTQTTLGPAPTVPPALSIFADGGAPAVMATYEAAISGEPSRLMQVILYPDYAFATAQDANNLAHVDEYPYRDGVVGASSPVELVGDGDLEANLFNLTDVDWTFIARAVAEAPGLVPQVEEAQVSHIIVERSPFTPDFAVEVHVYVDGPRGSAYLRYTPTGTFIEAVV